MPRSDFRSDTVTTPTDAMREAMARAQVGDDVMEEDPTVKRLEAEVASLLGKPAGLFVPSGTMANQIGVKLHTQPSDEIIAEASSHVLKYEAGGIGLISGVQCRPIHGTRGVMDPAEVEAAIRGHEIHLPHTSLICLENTNNVAGGAVVPLGVFDAVREIADRHAVKVHLDGARLLHAACAEGTPAAEFAARVDTVWIALSKGLSAPVGSVLCASVEDIARARRIRKILGGGMRQVGVLAAAGLVALETGIDRLAEDHVRARRLAEAANALPGVRVDLETARTNLVLLEFETPIADDVVARLAEDGVLAGATADNLLRFCTHREIGDDDVARAVESLSRILIRIPS